MTLPIETKAALAFEPLTVRGLTFKNRIWVSPMCQYCAVDGLPQDWHFVHVGSLAVGAPGLIMAEATAVAPEGRISPVCAGIWTDEQAAVWTRIVEFATSQGVPVGLQIAHAGRKGSMGSIAAGAGPVADADGGWEPVGPSALPYEGLRTPRALSVKEIRKVVEDFATAAKRAVAAGFSTIEIHGAHGYLIHDFLSPLSNVRTDEYGGSLENRSRLLFEIVDAVRAAIPESMPLFLRLSATDWVPGGWDESELVQLAPRLVTHGVDVFDISSGGLDARQSIESFPGYQLPFARAVRDVVDVPVAGVGLLTSAQQFEDTLATGDADAVFVGREFLRDRMLVRNVAASLGVEIPWPDPYLMARRSPRAEARRRREAAERDVDANSPVDRED